MSVQYIVRFALEDDIAALPEIEFAAAQLFDEADVASELRDETTSIEEFREAQREGRLWIASLGDHVCGFAYWDRYESDVYLAEMDVLPDHARQGLGTRLVSAIIEQARRKGAASVTLTTFRHVPWNAPFYATLGFEIIDDPSGYLEEILDDEAAAGLDRSKRVAMRLAL